MEDILKDLSHKENWYSAADFLATHCEMESWSRSFNRKVGVKMRQGKTKRIRFIDWHHDTKKYTGVVVLKSYYRHCNVHYLFSPPRFFVCFVVIRSLVQKSEMNRN